MNWIDTETKAILQKGDELRIAPPKVAEFALVLGDKGVDRGRLARAVCRINGCNRATAVALVNQPSPVTINSDMTEEEAVFGQFELICCDAVAAVVRSEVAEQADRSYLENLLQRISRSPEFETTTVQIDAVPMTESGQGFADQFLGMDLKRLMGLKSSRRFTMPAKKARIMKHWAARVGAQVHDTTAEPNGSSVSGS